MTRGRKPKPTHLKLIEGNPGKRPIHAGKERLVTAMPDPPDHLNDDARAEWERVAHGLHALRLLEMVDRAALAAYCTAYARWVQAERAIAEMAKRDLLTGGLMIKTSNGNAIQNPLVGTANKAASDMVRYAAEFGMTPSARVRLVVDGSGGASSKWAGLIGGVETG
jgi:P27 family predicted phage terminase small subunit